MRGRIPLKCRLIGQVENLSYGQKTCLLLGAPIIGDGQRDRLAVETGTSGSAIR